MEHITSELFIDLESGRLTTEEGTSQSVVSGNRKEKNLVHSIASGLLHFNGAVGGDNRVNAYDNLGEPRKFAVENVEVVINNSSGGEENEEHMALLEKEQVKEKHKKRNFRKASKPPRPPKGPSLDAADLKLVKEISAINMKKRARNEHLKALKKMKETKSLSSSPSSSSPSSSSPSSLSSSLSAMVITVLFFLVILYQGKVPISSLIMLFPFSVLFLFTLLTMLLNILHLRAAFAFSFSLLPLSYLRKQTSSKKHERDMRFLKFPFLHLAPLEQVNRIEEVDTAYVCAVRTIFVGFYSGGSPSMSFQGSPEPALATNSLISVQFYTNPSPNDGSGLGS